MKESQNKTKILKNHYVPTAEFYSQIIDSLQDYSILTLDNDFIINSWSSGAEKIFGYESEEIIGEHFDVIFTEEDQKNGIPKVETDTAINEGRAVDNRWHICKDGSKFYAYGLVFPLIGKEGELLGYVKILRDLTERRKAEDAIKKYVKELEELNNHKENILAIVSHDLRSPLSGIIGAAKYLSSNFEKMPKSEVKEMLDLLYKSSNDELNMLDYLVEWARIKYAIEAFAPKKIKLLGYVQKVFDKLNDTAQLNNIQLHHEIEENESVFADGKMLLSVFQNIVSNGIKHSNPGGKITVSSKRKDDKIIVEIKDNGIGMSKEIQEKLFTPQMNVLASARKKNKGAGIGLLLVKGFLEKNDGEIWVESKEGVGSSFYFTLPIDEPLNKIDSADKIEFDENV
jgi:PAS domain S-box-containing protein